MVITKEQMESADNKIAEEAELVTPDKLEVASKEELLAISGALMDIITRILKVSEKV